MYPKQMAGCCNDAKNPNSLVCRSKSMTRTQQGFEESFTFAIFRSGYDASTTMQLGALSVELRPFGRCGPFSLAKFGIKFLAPIPFVDSLSHPNRPFCYAILRSTMVVATHHFPTPPRLDRVTESPTSPGEWCIWGGW